MKTRKVAMGGPVVHSINRAIRDVNRETRLLVGRKREIFLILATFVITYIVSGRTTTNPEIIASTMTKIGRKKGNW